MAFCVSSILFQFSASAQIAISSGTTSYSYSQDFNTLASTGTGVTWANNSTLAGWSLFKTTSGTPVTTYDTGTGSATPSNFYSFGASGNSDRALGGLGGNTFNGTSTASGTVSGYIALSFLNNSGGASTAFSLNYDGEQWRNAGVTSTHTMFFEYGFGSSFTGVTSWTAAGSSFNFTSPTATTTSGALDGNATANRSSGRGGTVSGLNWANGSTLWLRWLETNESGNDHGLAIDNVSFSSAFAAAAASFRVMCFIRVSCR
ncbi:MAG: PEP-CTERM sorting domain-containing protein [Chitinophagia bacterium]|nr:PEP-CTERM sorting domain-containing protein [Chitinophagia bacterium]